MQIFLSALDRGSICAEPVALKMCVGGYLQESRLKTFLGIITSYKSRSVPFNRPGALPVSDVCVIMEGIMKKLVKIYLLFCWASSLSAADYIVKDVKLKPIESYVAQATVAGVTIAVDPYDSDEKSYKAFDVKHLNSRGYFPLHVIIRNVSSDFLIVRTRNIILITRSGEQLYSTPIAAILDDIFNPASVDKLSQSKSGKRLKKSKVGTPLSDFSAKDLTNKLIDPGKVSDGFLFFTNPDPHKNIFEGATLYIPKIEEEGTRKSIGPFSIPLDPALGTSR